MAKAKRKSPSFKAQYSKYKTEGRWLKNRIARLTRVAKYQPSNEQVQKALSEVRMANYNRNNIGANTCKGLYKEFGWVGNHSSKVTNQSKIHHTSPNYRKWYLPSAPKSKTATNTPTIWDQFISLGFSPRGKKY